MRGTARVPSGTRARGLGPPALGVLDTNPAGLGLHYAVRDRGAFGDGLAEGIANGQERITGSFTESLDSIPGSDYYYHLPSAAVRGTVIERNAGSTT